MKFTLTFLTLLISLIGCATTPIPVLSPGFTRVSELLQIDDPNWLDISKWPNEIKKKDIVYQIYFSGRSMDITSDNDSNYISTPKFSEINKQFSFSAHYKDQGSGLRLTY